MAVKCPVCGAENPDGKVFCGDCGAALTEPPRAEDLQRTRISASMARRTRLVVLAIAVAVIVILAAAFAWTFLIQPRSPKEVLAEWVERMNNEDAKGAADLTIYCKMDRDSYLAQVDYLARIVADMGTDRLVLNIAEDISEDDLIMEDWYSELPAITSMLQSHYNITIDGTMGVYASITFYDSGQHTVVDDSWPAFKVGSSWYLAYGLV